jgi:alanyl-tRNA synthetase
VLGHGKLRDHPTVILDRTAFYPQAGGQQADHGRLGEAAVLDVQEDDHGVIHHVLAGDVPAVGSTVSGVVDEARRRDFMAQHTGQHLLSQAVLREAGARTVSARLGESECTLDVEPADVPPEKLRAAEALVNAVIEQDLTVRAWFPPPDELATLKLRRPPKVAEHIRVVVVGDFEATACGGTHCLRTGQVGLLLVLGAERYKGLTRITFAAGARARRIACAQLPVLTAVGQSLSAAPLAVPGAVEALQRDLAAMKERLRAVRLRLVEREAADLLAASAGPEVVAVIDDADRETLRALAKRITGEPGRVALLAAPGPEGVAVLAMRSAGSAFDCGALLRAVLPGAGGQGGGRPDHAEGRLPVGADWRRLVTQR